MVIAIFAVIILSQYYRNKQALEGNGGTALYGNLPENSQSAADIELQDYIESSDDGFNVSDREEDKTTLSMKDKLLLKGKEMMNKGKDQLKKQGLIRKGSKHAVDTKKRGEYEMLPLNGKQAVFTIRGEDDDDDEQEEEVQFNPINTFESKPQT